MDLADYWEIVKKNKRFIIWFVFIVLILALIVSLVLPKTYESESIIQLAILGKTGERIEIYSTAEAKNIIQSSVVLNSVIEEFFPKASLKKFNKDNLQVEIISERIAFGEIKETSYLSILTRAEKAEKVKQLNEVIIDNFFNYATSIYEEKLNLFVNELNRLNKDIQDLEKEIASLSTNQLSGEGISKVTLLRSMLLDYKDRKAELEKILIEKREFKIINEPEVPKAYVKPSILTNLVLAFSFAFLFSLFYIFLKEYVKRK